MNSPRIWNDRLSQDQLYAIVRKFVKQEARRRDGPIAGQIPDDPTTPNVVRHRFMLPLRTQELGSATTINIGGSFIVAWALVAGAKDLLVKRVQLTFPELKGANLGSNVHRLYIRRFYGPQNILSLQTSSTTFRPSSPVCLSNSQKYSSVAASVSGGSVNISDNTHMRDTIQGPSWGVVGVTACNTANNIRRMPQSIEWCRPDDSTLFTVEAGTGVLIHCDDSATGETWPMGFIEWEE